MASLIKDPNGRRRIRFTAPDGKRKTIRLGRMVQKHAEAFQHRVESLLSAAAAGYSIDDETGRWLAGLDEGMAGRLAAAGLIPRRTSRRLEAVALGDFLDQYIGGRANLKPNTARNYLVTKKHLLDYFGVEKPLAEICPGDADQWCDGLLAAGMSPATLGREVKRARQFFRAAVRRKLIAENPFADVAAPPQVNPAREHFVTREVAQKVIDACPDAEWRLLFALARYGGLRIPSEALGLRWVDVNQGRLTVWSPKTERLPGGQSRIIPLFPEIRPYLEEVFDRTELGSVYMLPAFRQRGAAVNLRTRLERIIYRAGLVPWPRLWQNLRATRETELSESHPLHVVCQWIGNTARIAAAHYLQVTDRDFDRAVGAKNQAGGDPNAGRNAGRNAGHQEAGGGQNAGQQEAAENRRESQETPQAPGNQGLVPIGATPYIPLRDGSIPPGGVEPPFSD